MAQIIAQTHSLNADGYLARKYTFERLFRYNASVYY